MNRICFFVVFALLLQMPVLANTKHALVIAIGNYPEKGGWPQLTSGTDAKYVRSMLLKQDFKNEHIRILADSAATAEGITNAFKQLIHDVSAGDVVVLHFSCHGEQIESVDPNKLGGLDQSLVTYNAILPRLSKDFNKDQQAYYRGQVIGSHLQSLRNKLGKNGDVIVFMDYCHSGAGTRGVGKKRGGQPPFVRSNTTVKKTTAAAPSDVIVSPTKTNEADQASFVVISATRPEEFDLETEDNGVGLGSLTYAVCKSFEHLDANTTYRSLFARIQSVMNEKVPEQHPLIEGDGLDRVLFGGRYVPQKPYIEIDKFNSERELVLRVGLLGGLDTGAKVKLFPAGTNDPSVGTPLASGTIINASNFTSTVLLDKPLTISKPVDGWVFVTEPAYHIQPIHLMVVTDKQKTGQGGFSDADATTIMNGLKDLPIVSFEGKPDLMIVKGQKQDSIIVAIDGSLVTTMPDIAKNMPKLNEKMKEYAKYKFMKEIELKSEDANVEVNIIPIKNGKMDTGYQQYKLAGGSYDFHDNDTIVISARNRGKKDAYVNILDMQPDGLINPLLPDKNKGLLPNELKIRPGEYHIFDKHQIIIHPPYGVEVLKVFVSTEEIDMEGLATTVHARTRGIAPAKGNLSAMEKLVKASDGIVTRGLSAISAESSEGTAYNLIFRIVP